MTSSEKKTKAPRVKKEKVDKEDKGDGMKQTKLTFTKDSPEKGKKNVSIFHLECFARMRVCYRLLLFYVFIEKEKSYI